MSAAKPTDRPNNPNFSSGPCSKRPGWSLSALEGAFIGRSHRAKAPKARLNEVITLSKSILGMPEGWRLGIVPGSDTGAVEMAMWSLLGPRGVDVLVWEAFSGGWATDAQKQLPLDDVRVLKADYGKLPALSEVDWSRDVVFVWNGTTSGVRLTDGDWIKDDREGLAICDATSAAFAMDMPWDKLDVVTWSWQKVMGGEAAHGMLALSPRAVERLESYTPSWPMPKIFRMTKGGKLNEDIFVGSTINTPSMLIKRSEQNLAALAAWVDSRDWVEFLAEDPATRSSTSMCLKITADWFTTLDSDAQTAAAKKIGKLLDDEGVAYDIGSYRDAPAGLRIWGGATIETADLEALLPWLDWAYAQVAADAGA
jgi:phosphoserine aminotransferase